MATAETGPRRWQASLYARAGLFLALGAASFVGAMAVLSAASVEESVDRLLAERLDLARTVGAFVEARLLSDLMRLSAIASAPDDGRDGLQLALQTERGVGSFNGGALFLDARGEPLVGLPVPSSTSSASLNLRMLAARADHETGLAVSTVIQSGTPPRPTLALLRRVEMPAPAVRYVVGLLALDRGDVLGPLLRAHAKADTVIDLVDKQGVVAASTVPDRLALSGDHGEALARAIAAGRGVQGRCHGCHSVAKTQNLQRVQYIMAFSPMPSLALGVTVLQPERDALAPAFALQRRLLVLGVSFVALFLLFAGLSVRSVVDPIKRLTGAVRRLDTPDAAQGQGAIPAFGSDEVGELAQTLDRWHTGTRESLRRAEDSQAALHSEMDSTREILQALEQIAGLYPAGVDLHGIAERSLKSLCTLLGYPSGALRLQLAGVEAQACCGLHEADLVSLFARHAPFLPTASEGPNRLAIAPLEYHPATRFGVVGRHTVPQGLVLDFVLQGREQAAQSQNRWLVSLVHHIGIAATTRILHDREQQHTRQQERLLHQVLRAQEDERRRIARDLHDTVAQDLAALRLELERLSHRAEAHQLSQALLGLERRTSDVLAAVRHTLFDLRLTVLENVGFVATLQSMLERLERDHGVRGILAVHGVEREPPYETAVALVRIVQESIQNIVLHANARFVSLTLTYRAGEIALLLEDDGQGFDAQVAHRGNSYGFGTLGMLERARLVGGHLQIDSTLGEGTSVEVRVPLPAAPCESPKETL